MQQLAWVAIDWGTSSLRCWGMSSDGEVLFEQANDQGMNNLAVPEAFEQLLLRLLSPYLHSTKTLPVICCGMVGAKQGWQDVGYQTLPWHPNQTTPLAQVNNTDPRIQVFIVSGLCQSDPADVMRGEETQLAGWLAQNPTGQVACLPGTHSKWVQVQHQTVTGFRTYMTGELFALIAKQSILRFSVADKSTDNIDAKKLDEVFVQTIQEVQVQPHKVAQWLFSIRAKDILAKERHDSANTASARLSALLIGQELMAAQDLWQGHEVAFIGNVSLTKNYQLALTSLGQTSRIYVGEDLVLAGLQSVYNQFVFNKCRP